MFNSRMVIAALYSEQTVELSKDIEKFERIFSPNKNKQFKHENYSDLKKTQVGKYGYGCLRDDSHSFKVSNHMKIFNAIEPQNGEYFTEKEFSKIIRKSFLSNTIPSETPSKQYKYKLQ